MKKLITAILVLAIVSMLSVTAFAADDETVINPGSGDDNGSISVTYTVSPSFTVTIPAEVRLNTSVVITAENVRVNKGQVVNVSLTGINTDDTDFKVTTDEGADLIYTVTKGTGVNVAKNDKVLTVAPAAGGNSASETITFVAPDDSTIVYAGDYSGTVTFTVSVDAEQN